MKNVICAMSNTDVVFRGYGLILKILGETIGVWESSRQINMVDPERFGVLIGSRTDGAEEYLVDGITTPYSDDQASRSSFLLCDESHQHAVDIAFHKSGGTSIYLGTWHTHPQKIPMPSSVDKRDWVECVSRNPGRQLFFIIVGIDEVRVYVRRRWRFGFGQLQKES